jgi:hypothetical protein
MKNHAWVDGQILQTNKKWSHLKQKQRLWIYEATKEEHAAYVENNGRLPMKSGRDAVLDKVYGRICERGIWIPWGEAKLHLCKFIGRLNRKALANDSPEQGLSAETASCDLDIGPAPD